MASAHYARVSDSDDEGLQLNRDSTAYDPLPPDHIYQQQPTTTQLHHESTQPFLNNTTSEQDRDDVQLHVNAHSPSSSTSSLDQPLHQPSISNDDNLHPHRTGVISPELRRPSMEERLKYSFSPSTHHLKYPSDRFSLLSAETVVDHVDTSRVYSYWRQTRRLWRLAAGEWLITAALCATYGGVLALFSRKSSISSKQVTILNAVFTMLTFLLGVNLTASMRSYAKLLRWILLSLCYQPLETFDLLLRCDSLLNVCKLAWKASRHPSRRLRWTTQFLCAFWLLSNMAVTLFVGMIGLTYNTEPSVFYADTFVGTAKIKDFSKLQTASPLDDQKLIQTYGIQGFNTKMFEGTDGVWPAIRTAPITYRDGWTRNFFTSWNPTDSSMSMVNNVNLYVNANCTGYDVLVGGGGTSSVVKYKNSTGALVPLDITPTNATLPGPGGFTAISYQCSTCTGRWTHVDVFVAGNDANSTGKVFACDASVGEVWWNDPSNSSKYGPAPDTYQFSNETARALAGAIGWSGDFYLPDDFAFDEDDFTDDSIDDSASNITSGVSYSRRTPIAVALRTNYGTSMPSAQNVSDFVSSFTAKAIDAIDSAADGLQFYKEAFGLVPLRAQELKVDWKNTILLLVGIPALQLCACILVFTIANKAIIKDDSALSMAKLYYNLLGAHGLSERGSMLKGDELVDVIEQKTGLKGGPMVIYGWKEKDRRDDQGRAIGRLDVYEEEKMSREMEVVTPDSAMTLKPKPRVKTLFYGGLKYD